MASPTSPHLFKDANETDLLFLDTELKKNKCAVFIRKIAPEFPDDVLRHYIYNVNHSNNQLTWKPLVFIYNDLVADLRRFAPFMFAACIGYVAFTYM
jgi:hypothetical protein